VPPLLYVNLINVLVLVSCNIQGCAQICYFLLIGLIHPLGTQGFLNERATAQNPALGTQGFLNERATAQNPALGTQGLLNERATAQNPALGTQGFRNERATAQNPALGTQGFRNERATAARILHSEHKDSGTSERPRLNPRQVRRAVYMPTKTVGFCDDETAKEASMLEDIVEAGSDEDGAFDMYG
jgi:hypothetical protein